jgi:CBS domain containing-hemolysin-like protein
MAFMSQFVLILLAFLFVALNGFFVMAEFALVKVRHTQVQTLQAVKGWRGKTLAKVHGKLDAYLSACQLGITLASLGLGWIGEPAFAYVIAPLLRLIGISSQSTIEWLAFVVAFTLISFLHIVVGELMPKSMAIRRSAFWSLWTAVPLYLFYWAMYPAIALLNLSANAILKLLRLNSEHHSEQTYSATELKLILKASHLHGELTKVEAEMLEHTLEFAELTVADVMRPAEDIVSLDINKPLQANLKLISEQRYSRYPVYLNERDHIIGILHIKDLFAATQSAAALTELKPLLRPVLKVKPTTLALDLFQQFKQGMPHFALVYRRGRIIGFVTLDNLLQVLIGRIKDEFHFAKQDAKILKDGSFIVKGSSPIYTLEQLLDCDLDEHAATTVSGLILQHLQRFPIEAERIDFANFYLVVEKVQGQRIEKVHVYGK